MPKLLLVGPPGSGKTYKLLNSFQKHLESTKGSLEEPDSFFIVPSREHVDRITTLLAQRGVKGVVFKRITTFNDLIKKYFHIQDPPVISNLSRLMLIKEIIHQGNWPYFESSKEFAGFYKLLSQFILEIKESCIDPKDFRDRMNTIKAMEPEFSLKYEALAAVYERYEKRLQEMGYRDSQDILKYRDENAETPELGSLWFDGFFDFTPMQLQFFKLLTEKSKNTAIALTWDPARKNTFEILTTFKKQIEDLGFESKKLASTEHRFKGELKALSENLFLEEPRKYAEDISSIEILKSYGVQGEVEQVSREILGLVCDQGYRLSEIAILTRQIGNYGPLIRSVFERYGISVEIHEREKLQYSSWMTSVSHLLLFYHEDWKKEYLSSFLNSAFISKIFGEEKSAATLYEFEKVLVQNGILSGEEKWKELNNSLEEGPVKSILEGVIELGEKFKSFSEAQEFTDCLTQLFFREFKMIPENLDSSFSSKRIGAGVVRFEKLLGEIRAYFKQTAQDFEYGLFVDQFLRLIDLDLFSVPEKNPISVQVYDVSLARQKEYKAVFVMGMVEGDFPLRMSEDALLSDWERSLSNQQHENGLALKLPRQTLEKYLFFMAVTRAKEKLFLSYSAMNHEGKESLPSFYLSEVQNIFEKEIPVKSERLAHPYPKWENVYDEYDMKRHLMGSYFHEEGTDEKVEAIGHLFKNKEDWFKNEEELYPQELNAEIVEGGHLKIKEPSPTRIEEYAKCPYKYFSNRLLKLTDVEEDKNLMNQGSIMHGVLENYFKVYNSNPSFILSEGGEAWLKNEIETLEKEYPLKFKHDYQKSLAMNEIESFLKRFFKKEVEYLQKSNFHPQYMEYSFGSGEDADDPPLEIEGVDVPLQGKIDRIDVSKEDGKYFVIADYKRAFTFKKSDLDLGVSLQLPYYLFAIEKKLGLKGVGIQIINIKDAKRSGIYSKIVAEFSPRSSIEDGEFQETIQRSIEFFKQFLGEINEGKIPVMPRNCSPFCGYSAVCRIEKWKLPKILQEFKSNSPKVDGALQES